MLAAMFLKNEKSIYLNACICIDSSGRRLKRLLTMVPFRVESRGSFSWEAEGFTLVSLQMLLPVLFDFKP